MTHVKHVKAHHKLHGQASIGKSSQMRKTIKWKWQVLDFWIPGLKGNNFGLEGGQGPSRSSKDHYSQIGWWGYFRVTSETGHYSERCPKRLCLNPNPNTTSQDPVVPKPGPTLNIFGEVVQFPKLQKTLGYSRLCLEQIQSISHVKPGMGTQSATQPLPRDFHHRTLEVRKEQWWSMNREWLWVRGRLGLHPSEEVKWKMDMNWQWNGESTWRFALLFILTTAGTTWAGVAPSSTGGAEEERNPEL